MDVPLYFTLENWDTSQYMYARKADKYMEIQEARQAKDERQRQQVASGELEKKKEQEDMPL